MDDPWSTNAWSTEDDHEVPFQINRPEWETSENDAELDPTGLPPPSSWSIPSGSAWDVGNDVWTTNDNTSYDEPWNAKESTISFTQIVPETTEKPADLETARPALPTPPSSPLAIPSRLVASEIPETDDAQTLDVPEHSETLSTLATPDRFGSFESAQEAKPFASSDADDEPIWPKELVFETDNSLQEPWKSTWDSPVDEKDATDSQPKDDWEPQELLRLILSRWEAVAEEHYSQYDLSGELDYSWRKGLDNVPGLSERIDNFLPSSYFALPTSFPKSEIAKAVKESLRLTRSYALSQSSPMAQFYASKGSLEWENSVKMQKSAANDEWGWDLKQVQEEMSDSAAKEPEKRGSGFLSFWKRRTASESTTATSNTQPELVQLEKKEQTPMGPAPPTSSPLRPSLDNPPSTPLPSKAPLESTVSPTGVTTPDYDQQQPQPSVVSRFFNRLSRRPASGIIVETTEHSPSSSSAVSLSADDLAFLSDIAPSDPKPKSSLSIHKASGSVNSLGEVLSFSIAKKDQLPAPLAPPPASSSRILPAVEGLKNKVKKGVDAIDFLDDDLTMSSPSSVDRMPHLDRANLLFDDISIFENKSSTSASRTSLDLSLISSSSRVDVSTPPNLPQPPPPPQLLYSQPRASSSSSPQTSASIIPPPPSKVGHSKPFVSHSVLSSGPQSLDDFSDFVSSNHNKSTTAFDNNDIDDFGDFGDFVSTSEHDSLQKTTQSNSKQQVEFRGTSSVTIPILKPPPKFATVGSDFIGRNTDNNRVRSSPLSSGKSSPLPQLPLQSQSPPQRQPPWPLLRPPQQQQTTSASSPSLGKTALAASSTKKSGLSAQDLSFFEGL